ncbi:uncharacterized protein LOC143246064 [Tachypleus tridentatus]|uniref:uncharacterized protein LOC143246064 n=1 Tax=Tachypleus tridentatus TaxID=6853 RepID=UPI003FD13FB5
MLTGKDFDVPRDSQYMYFVFGVISGVAALIIIAVVMFWLITNKGMGQTSDTGVQSNCTPNEHSAKHYENIKQDKVNITLNPLSEDVTEGEECIHAEKGKSVTSR